MLTYRIISQYWLDGVEYITREALNEKGERVWVQQVPLYYDTPIKTVHILDKKNDVDWEIKESHLDEYMPGLGKVNRETCLTAGSVSVPSGVNSFCKAPNDNVYVVPLNPVDEAAKVTSCILRRGNCSGIVFTVEVDAPTWIGFVTDGGTVSIFSGTPSVSYQ